jgi:hypothetical protein
MKNRSIKDFGKRGKIDIFEVARYIRECYDNNNIKGISYLRNSYIRSRKNEGMIEQQANKLVDTNLGHAACLADIVQSAGFEASGMCMVLDAPNANKGPIYKFYKSAVN